MTTVRCTRFARAKGDLSVPTAIENWEWLQPVEYVCSRGRLRRALGGWNMILEIALAAASFCATAERKSQIDQNDCYGRLVQITDREMSEQYRAAMATARREDIENRRDRANKPIMTTGLLASQRAWLRYRDAQCSMISDQWAGGTGYGQIDNRCRIDLNRKRTLDLKRRADGNLNPPNP